MVGRFTTRMLSRLLAARPVTELWCQARSVQNAQVTEVSLDTFKSSMLLSNHHTFQGELQKNVCVCDWKIKLDSQRSFFQQASLDLSKRDAVPPGVATCKRMKHLDLSAVGL